MTPWGAYRFKRNVMGLISAGDERNRHGEEPLKGIENLVKVVEEFYFFDNYFDAHIETVRQVFLRCNEAGITVHPNKLFLLNLTSTTVVSK